MPTGKKKPQKPSKTNHMSNFDEAMNDALSQWNASKDEDARVTFEVSVTANPGGVKEYRVVINPGP